VREMEERVTELEVKMMMLEAKLAQVKIEAAQSVREVEAFSKIMEDQLISIITEYKNGFKEASLKILKEKLNNTGLYNL